MRKIGCILYFSEDKNRKVESRTDHKVKGQVILNILCFVYCYHKHIKGTVIKLTSESG